MAEPKEVPLHRERLNLVDKNQYQKVTEAKKKQLRQDMASCFNSIQGRNVLRYLISITGYRKSKVGGNPALGMNILEGTLYNSARELVGIEFLEMVPAHILKDIEYGTIDELDG